MAAAARGAAPFLLTPLACGALALLLLEAHRARLLQAYLADWGERPFPRRIYVRDRQAFGEDEMWLEPQGFTLLFKELPPARKRALFAELESRLMAGGALGARQIEAPKARPGWEAGSRENGGFWYALNGPLILGVASFDRPAASALPTPMPTPGRSTATIGSGRGRASGRVSDRR